MPSSLHTLWHLILLGGCFRVAPATPADSAEPPPTDLLSPAPLSLSGVVAPHGTLLWCEDCQDASPALQYRPHAWAAWQDVVSSSAAVSSWADGWVWWVPRAAENLAEAEYRLLNQATAGPPLRPLPLEGGLSLTPSHGAALNGEPLSLHLGVNIPSGPLFSLVVLANDRMLSLRCLEQRGDASCCVGTNIEKPARLQPGWSEAQWTWHAEVAGPQEVVLRTEVRWQDETIWSAAVETRSLGRRVFWGDLHAHSGLSHDGCEEEADACLPRDALNPGADFFEQARSQRLDFAATTEHAEYLWYAPPDQPGSRLPIWDVQRERVLSAEGVVPLLGYEWTFARQDQMGGHKTVLLEEDDPCDARHIGAFGGDAEEYLRGNGERFYGINGHSAFSFSRLWSKLAEAADACGGERALTFSHHPAWTPPEMTDWTLPENAPDPTFEPVIEIHSEHASSECADLTAPGCAWGLAPARTHHPTGAVQTALLQGYILGFVGGTDSHDGRPGSIADGPSCVGRWEDNDGDGYKEAIQCHEHSGALTGLYRPEADLTRADVFDALFARETLVTSGPRIPVRAALRDAQGALHLPGAQILPGEALLILAIHDDDLQGLELLEATLLTPDNRALAWSDQIPMTAPVSLAAGETAYLRLHLWDPDTQTEHRIWLSPWFARDA